jgi:Asp-tRNA(Asn)/Glu-tRNA(Gln) amidotransferase A subunit family amidase
MVAHAGTLALEEATIADMHAAYRAGTCTVHGVIAAYQASGTFRGPLHGIPVIVKDNLDAIGMPMTAGFQGWKKYYPRSALGRPASPTTRQPCRRA